MKTLLKLCLLTSFSIFSFSALAQNNLPPVYEILTDTGVYTNLPESYWQILEDKDGKLTFEQVSKFPVTEKFYANSVINGIDYSIHTFWIRYRLKNIMNKEINIGFSNVNSADQSDFYIDQYDNKWIHRVTGYLYPWKERDGLKWINYIPIILQPQKEVIIYNRIKNNYYLNKPKSIIVSIGITDKMIQSSHITDETNYVFTILTSLFTGVLLFAIVFNLSFFIIVKERVYLYYLLFLLYLAFYNFYEQLIDIFFKENPAPILYLNQFTLNFGVLFYLQFVRHYSRTFHYLPRWDKVLQGVVILLLLSSVCFFVEPSLSGRMNGVANAAYYFIGDAGLFSILITLILLLQKRIRSARLLIFSALPTLIFEPFSYTILNLYDFVIVKNGKAYPELVLWLKSKEAVIDTACLCWLVFIFSGVLFQRFLQLKKENFQQILDKERLSKEKEMERSQLIEQQKVELEKRVTERTAELKQSLENLKSTQAQLIQSEKMASLGELTAGIAHEIQNPLNFVNNFSEVNTELVDELQTELKAGNTEDAFTISNDIKDNEQKINHHGKRADAIVKGMLQHSRVSTGQKELTDINALADEYLRLSYHGLRAKDKTFNATLQTDFDKSIEKINIIPQDIGRVLLNLFNNAFYAVMEKKKQQGEAYEPTISVCTKKVDGKIEIHVRDNGVGIPQKDVDKIFQPFFTTKPTGQGTGLGLSLSYDIIKAHSGEIKVETKEGEGAEFIIEIPIT